VEKQVNDALAALKAPPLTSKDSKPMDCGDVAVFTICNKTVYDVTISAWGHAFPPGIERVVVMFWSNDPETVKLGVIIALLIYDPSVIINDRKDKVQPLLDALSSALSTASDHQANVDGVDARYTAIQQVHGKLTFTIEPRK